MWPIICSPPAASTRGARLEGPGPSRSRLGTHRGERRPSGGETSSWCEAMVRTQPATPQPQKCARRGQRTRSLSQLPRARPAWFPDPSSVLSLRVKA